MRSGAGEDGNVPNWDVLRERVRRAFDPQLLRTLGRRLSDLLARHFAAAMEGRLPVMGWRLPKENVREASACLDKGGGKTADGESLADAFESLLERALSRGNQLHNPRYVGHQVPPPIPIAAWFDAVGAMTNQVMAVYEMGPWATAMEKAMVDRLGRAIGWAKGEFSGLITHGGSLANLTALLTARNVCFSAVWKQGVCKEAAPLILAHQDAHYSVTRAAGILGLGTENVERIPSDNQRRMDAEALRKRLCHLRREKRTVMAVVACACATPIGSFDPLRSIGQVCREFGVWLHVDAAHGGSALLSRRHRDLVDGLALADSVVWDAHKMLYVPGLCAFVFYRRAECAGATFHQSADYLFDPTAPQLGEFDIGRKTVECTKRAAAFGLWGVWSLFGESLFADLVDLSFSMGKVFYELLLQAEDFCPLHVPECNIVVFRHLPAALAEASQEVLGNFQLRLRRRVVEKGLFYLVSTKIDGVGALRTTIINPLTTRAHLAELLETLRREGKALLEESSQQAN